MELADRFAVEQREISVAEFFEKNRHLMGFESGPRAMLTAVKEMVDNSLDACEQARILPDIKITIVRLDGGLFRVKVEDNGPGIADTAVPGVFGKLLYGSRFHSSRQSRGQQGMGISSAVLYSQLTSGLPARVVTSTSPDRPAKTYEVQVGIHHNEPEVLARGDEPPWNTTGTMVEIVLEAIYVRGRQSVPAFLEATALVNPHTNITFCDPFGETTCYEKRSKVLPPVGQEVLPHPNGVELGTLLSMLESTRSERILPFLINEFSRLGRYRANKLCADIGINPSTPPHDISRNLNRARLLHESMRAISVSHPTAMALSPIGEDLLKEGIRRVYNADFIATASRQPFSCGGYPMVVEAAIAYGGELQADGVMQLMRFANRVPLLYQSGACAITRAAETIAWKRYRLERARNERLPRGPLLLAVHVASSNVPFTSESKDALSSTPEVLREIELTVKEAARLLRAFLVRNEQDEQTRRRAAQLRAYNREVTTALTVLTGSDPEVLSTSLDDLVNTHLPAEGKGDGGQRHER